VADPTSGEIERRLRGAGGAADEAVRSLGDRDERLRRAATTLTAAAIVTRPSGGAEAHVLHAGDSRAYRFAAAGELEQITTDHTWVESAVRSGELSAAAAETHPQRNVIVEFLGRPEGCEFEMAGLRLDTGQGLLLCSDGASGVLRPDALAEAVRRAPDPDTLVTSALALVNQHDGADDATIVALLPPAAVDPFGLRRANAPSRIVRVARAARRPVLVGGAVALGAAALASGGIAAWRLLSGGPSGPPDEAARAYLAALQQGDYAALYPSLSRRARESIAQEAFVQRHEAIAAEMTLAAVDLRLLPPESTGGNGGDRSRAKLPFEAHYRTARFGGLRRHGELPLVWEDGRWAVDWSPAVVLPELGGGRLVRAVSDPAARGSVLDRSARPLAATTGTSTRTYPQGPVAGPLTGYVGQVSAGELKTLAPRGYLAGDVVGRAGIEAAAETLLAGQRGGRLTIIQPNGDLAETLATVPPRSGESVVLTIDADVQREVEAALGSRPGSAIVIDARSGAIRALASAPRYDPNAFTRDGDPAAILNDPAQPLIVRPLHGQYPAGSTFKVVTMAAALESGAFQPTSEFTCSGRWTGLPSITFDCWLRTGHGRLNLVEGLTHSCNSVFYEVGKRLDEIDSQVFPATAAQCGIGTAVGVAAGIEATGVAPSPAWKQRTLRDGWARGDAVNMAIGQGHLLVTPLQLAAIYQGIATAGQGPGLKLIDRTLLPGGSVERMLANASPVVKWSASTLDAIRAGLRDVVGTPTGTAAHIFQGSPLAALVAGKTGTAEAGPGRMPHAWFACYAPFEAPKAVVLVMIENAGEGSGVAAPVARRILEAVLDRI
jgi:penicillin-binding protein 2